MRSRRVLDKRAGIMDNFQDNMQDPKSQIKDYYGDLGSSLGGKLQGRATSALDKMKTNPFHSLDNFMASKGFGQDIANSAVPQKPQASPQAAPTTPLQMQQAPMPNEDILGDYKGYDSTANNVSQL